MASAMRRVASLQLRISEEGTPIRFALSGQRGRGLREVRRGEGLADPVVLFDGNVETHLRRLTAVGQGEEFVSDFNVFFDFLSECCAFFTEL